MKIQINEVKQVKKDSKTHIKAGNGRAYTEYVYNLILLYGNPIQGIPAGPFRRITYLVKKRI